MGELATSADVVVIGAGPGGYVAAIRAAQRGKKVLLVDKTRQLGGICLHHGCIPSKALITAAGFAHKIEAQAKHMGIKVSKPKIDAKQMQSWKQDVVDKLAKGIEGLLEQHNIEVVEGTAQFASPKQVRIEGNRTVEFRHAIIATGSCPSQLPGFDFDEEYIVSSRGALRWKKVPESLIIIGGGYIGCELGMAYAKLGAKVTIIQHGDHVLPFVTEDVASILEHHMEELGIELILNASAKKAAKTKKGVEVTVGKSKKLAERVLVAVGRRPNTKALALEKARVDVDDHGFIKVDEQQRTSNKRIFAIGDCAPGPALAHKASMEGKVAADVIAGEPAGFDQLIPSVIFTDPEIAFVGLNEHEAAQQYEVKVGKFPFSASGRAVTLNENSGFVKVIADKESDVVLGVTIIGPEASNLISEAVLAMEMGARTEDLALTIHPHPTLPESINEAAEAVHKKAIHIFQG